MQQSSHIGNARREDRMLLSALIELRSERDEEALTADGLDVSPSGLAVRAAFVPEVGTRLYCDFRCPPHDDAVHALTEVVWSAWDGPRSGTFGLRFVELDTKSATTIRRFVEPEAVLAAQVAQKRVANMHIEGVGTPIEADVRLLEKDCVVLEQELGFLRLGRGIAVDVPGRGSLNGRIASIELRQGPLDTPTLVFGVLLDERVTADVSRRARPIGSPRRVEAAVPEPHVVATDPPAAELTLMEPAAEAPDALTTLRTDPLEGVEPISAQVGPAASDSHPRHSERPEAPAPAARPARSADAPQVVRVAREPIAEELDAETEALQNRVPESLLRLRALLRTCFLLLRTQVYPAYVNLWQKARERAAGEELSTLGANVRAKLSTLRVFCAAQWGKLRLRRRRRTTAPTPRVQRSQVGRVQRTEPARPPRNRRVLTLALAAVGVGIGVYALAPRSGADRIRIRALASSDSEPDSKTETAPGEASESATSSDSAEAALSPTVQALPSAAPQATTADPTPETADSTPEPPSLSAKVRRPAPFGEAEVQNGRTFVLRMSGPVTSLEGDKRDDGFTVRIPGRLALDRASPIASSHRAVARALILNRGEYAELTVEFLPGMRPKYQVAAKDNTLEVTLERP